MFRGMVHFGVKYGVESCYFVLPRQFAFGYLVEFFLHPCGEVEIHDVGEIFAQEGVDHGACVGWQEFAAVTSCGFAACFGGDFFVILPEE